MTVQRLLSEWRSDGHVGGNIVEWRSLPARPARTLPFPPDLHPALADLLIQSGIRSLYIHQSAVWQSIHEGRHAVMVTGTASGKTLGYNLPVFDCLLRQPSARALYLFPTKALSQDQLAMLRAAQTTLKSSHPHLPDLSPAIYDGDTPSHDRPPIRKNARLLLTNPDMLHTGILPHHTVWSDFFRNLRFVVIDEIHIYRGVFGSHMANVLRRLRRIARFYGSQPIFLLTSATIANPGDFAEKLIEAPVTLVGEDGSARGAKSFLLYNPPLVDPALGLRRSALQESVRLAEDLLAHQLQTILFARSRRSVEIILTYLRERFSPALSNAIRGYRSGYLPAQRRAIERGLRTGQVRAVVATNALELGIDIGGMGAALLVGYPGSIAATWQQAGRAGRGDETSLAILVATPDPLDQFLASHPDYLFDRSPENALINPNHLLILLDHLRCAAFELPFQEGENFGTLDPGLLHEYLEFLQQHGVLHHSADKYYWMADQYPAQGISLRSASSDLVSLRTRENDLPVTIGQVDYASAFWLVHPQAVYLHEGQPYLVEELDFEHKVAWLQTIQNDYYTEPLSQTTVELLEKSDEAPAIGSTIAHGEIQVTRQVTGFRKIQWGSHEHIGAEELDLPPSKMVTTGYWIALSEQTIAHLRDLGLWNNDNIDYGPNWHAQRNLARRRDLFRCQVCGAFEGERQHDVHHRVPFRSFPSFEQANQLENLVTLCHACHRRVELAVRVRSGLAGLAYVLHHIAPLFLMCDTNDLGVHSDPQLPFADGSPAVVIYDQVPAGIGFSQRLFEIHSELLQRARELVTACPCTDGCPSCVGPGGENGVGGKTETLAILRALTEAVNNS